jgi:DnaJ-class molecular chaperone
MKGCKREDSIPHMEKIGVCTCGNKYCIECYRECPRCLKTHLQQIQDGTKKHSTVSGFDFSDLGDLGDIFAAKFSTKPTSKNMEYPVEITPEESRRGTKRIFQFEEICPDCSGKGRIGIINKGKPSIEQCQPCKGLGKLPKRLEVIIPPNIKDGQKIRIAGHGKIFNRTGDLFLIVKISQRGNGKKVQ